MTDRRHLLLTGSISLLVVVLGCVVLVWPARREARRTSAEIVRLERKIESLADAADAVERLTDELAQVRHHAAEQLKGIPDSPDVAGLMRKLSMPVDGRNVLDQTFTAGSAHPAASGDEFSEQAMPLTVDMQASFDSVFALLCASESMDRLVRVASVHLVSARVADQPGSRSVQERPDDRMLMASVGLEVIYEPPITGEDR
jgi:hypothetical protein